MNYTTGRAIMIGIAIIITISITSAVIIVLSYVLDIYRNVSRIDYSELVKVNDFEKYSVSIMNSGNFDKENSDTISGLQLYNLVNKCVSEHNLNVLSYNGQARAKVKAIDKGNTVKYDTDLGVVYFSNKGNRIEFDEENKSSIESTFISRFYCFVAQINDEYCIYIEKKSA